MTDKDKQGTLPEGGVWYVIGPGAEGFTRLIMEAPEMLSILKEIRPAIYENTSPQLLLRVEELFDRVEGTGSGCQDC